MIRKPFNLYEPIRNGPSLQMPAYGDRKSGDCLLSSLPKLSPHPLKHKSTQSPTLDHECGSGHCKSPAWSKPFFDRPNILIVLSVMEITSKNTTETVIIMIKNFRENGLNCKKLRFYLQEKNIRWSSSWQYCFQYWVSNANVCPYFLRLYCWSVFMFIKSVPEWFYAGLI